MAKKTALVVQAFAVLVNGHFQTVRGDLNGALEVRDNFNEMFIRRGVDDAAQVVKAILTYDPKDVVKL